MLKFVFSKKATKIDEIFTADLTLILHIMISSIFVAYLENMNFNLNFLFNSISGDLATLAAARSTDGSPEVLPKSWENFERVHNTQKRMPKLVYNQLKKGKKD